MTASPSIPINWVAGAKRGARAGRPFPESVGVAGPVADCGYLAGSGALFLDGSSDPSGSRDHRERCRECPIDDEIAVLGELRVRLRQRTPGRPTRDGRAAEMPPEQLRKYPQRPSGLETTLARRTQAQWRCCRARAVEQHGRPLHEHLDAVATLLPRRRQHVGR